MFDVQKIANDFSGAAMQYDLHAQLQTEVREKLLHTLMGYHKNPIGVCDIGAGTGAIARALPDADVISVDLAHGMCKQTGRAVQANALQLPFANASFTIVTSNLMLQWVEDWPAAFAEIARILKPGGVAVMSCFMHGTLRELEVAFKTIDDTPHISPFKTAKDAAHPAFELLHYDESSIRIEYEHFMQMIGSLRAIGAGNKLHARKKTLTTPRQWKRLEVAYGKPVAHWQVGWWVMRKI